MNDVEWQQFLRDNFSDATIGSSGFSFGTPYSATPAPSPAPAPAPAAAPVDSYQSVGNVQTAPVPSYTEADIKALYAARGNNTPDAAGLDWWLKQANSGALQGQQLTDTFNAAFTGASAPAPAGNTPAPATQTPGWLSGANQWLSSGQSGTSGGSYYDQATGKYIMPTFAKAGYDSATGDYASGALTGWNAYDRLPGNNASDYSNTPFTSFDATGKQTGTGQFGDNIGGTDWIQKAVQLGLMAGGGAVLGNAVGLIGAPGGGGVSAGTGAIGGSTPGLTGGGLDAALQAASQEALAAYGGAGTATTGAGIGAEAATGIGVGAGPSGGLYSLAGGAGAPASGLGLSAGGGGLGLGTGTGLGLGEIGAGASALGGLAGLGGSSGTGLQASIGSGLDLYKQTGGGLGLNVATGEGLNLFKEMGDGLGLKLTPEAISNWTTIGKSLEGLGATEAIKRLTDSGLMTKATGTGSGITINNNTGGAGINDLMGIIAGLYGSAAQNNAAGEQRAWLDKQMSDINKLYAPGSPEHELLKQEMERKDAAAGRNSQYGPRATDLAAKIAEIKARNIATLAGSTQGNVMNSITADKTSLNSLLAALGKSGPSVTNVSSLLDLFK